MKFLTSILHRFRKPTPPAGTYLLAQAGAVTLLHNGVQTDLTPALARRLADELPALATIAERLEAQP